LFFKKGGKIMNKVSLIGRLTKDVEVRYTQTTNTMVANFTLAVKRRMAKEGEQQADFINCIAWGKTAEFVSKYFKKGNQLGACGRIQTRTWEDNGQKHYATEVIVEEIYFTESKKDEPTDVTSDIYEGTMTAEDTDLPF
jgi:single-strand DNA-binding protein